MNMTKCGKQVFGKISMKMTKSIENEYLETLMKMTKMKQMGIWKP
jgi:hypothetical protein